MTLAASPGISWLGPGPRCGTAPRNMTEERRGGRKGSPEGSRAPGARVKGLLYGLLGARSASRRKGTRFRAPPASRPRLPLTLIVAQATVYSTHSRARPICCPPRASRQPSAGGVRRLCYR